LDVIFFARLVLVHWWVLAPIMVIGLAAGYAVSQYIAPVYRAKCRFEIVQDSRMTLAAPSSLDKSFRQLQRHILTMKSEDLDREIRSKLAKRWGEEGPSTLSRSVKVSIKSVREARGTMLDLSVDSFDPDYSREYLERLIEGYQERRREETRLINDNTLRFLRGELARLSEGLKESENKIIDFERNHNLRLADRFVESDKLLLADMLSQRNGIRMKRAILESQLRLLTESDDKALADAMPPSLPAPSPPDKVKPGAGEGEYGASKYQALAVAVGMGELTEWRKHTATRLRLQAELAEKQKIMKPEHPEMVSLRERMRATEKDLTIDVAIIVKRLRAQYEALQMQEAALVGATESLRMHAGVEPGDRVEYEKLQAEVGHLKRLHDAVFTNMLSAMSNSVDPYFTRLVENPKPLPEPVWPNKMKIVLASEGAALGGGLAIILLMFIFNRRRYDFTDFEIREQIHCLAGIPKFIQAKRRRRRREINLVVVQMGVEGLANECYRSLRTSIESLLKPEDKILLLTSPEPAAGKTFNSLNTAVVFSWSFKRVLLVDGDFRHRRLQRVFPNAPAKGLMDCLAAPAVKWRDCVYQTDIKNLDFLPSGFEAKNSTELLNTGRLPQILSEIREAYDIAIVDSAPVNRVVDSILLAKRADAVMLIAQAGGTTAPEFRYCLNRLAQSRIIGYVLNNIDSSSYKYSYYYFGRYNYSHYFSSYQYYKGYYGAPPPKSPDGGQDDDSGDDAPGSPEPLK